VNLCWGSWSASSPSLPFPWKVLITHKDQKSGRKTVWSVLLRVGFGNQSRMALQRWPMSRTSAGCIGVHQTDKGGKSISGRRQSLGKGSELVHSLCGAPSLARDYLD
jgi:hypothetical protein